jgi:YD repeat-containing protein
MLLKRKHTTFIFLAVIAYIFMSVITSFAETLYTYDDNNRLIRESYDDGTVIIYVYDNIGNRLQKFTYSGSSQLPNISAAPASKNFGSINVGYKSSQKTFTVSNTGF